MICSTVFSWGARLMNSNSRNRRSLGRSSQLLRALYTLVHIHRLSNCSAVRRPQKSSLLGRYLLAACCARARRFSNPTTAQTDSNRSLLLQAQYPSILDHFDDFTKLLHRKRLAVFLDYDGKLQHSSTQYIKTFSTETLCWIRPPLGMQVPSLQLSRILTKRSCQSR